MSENADYSLHTFKMTTPRLWRSHPSLVIDARISDHDLMANFDQFIAALWERHPDPQKRGLEFERVCKWYLETDPTYVTKLEEVWLWKEWPGRWADEDTGIDLVARDTDGGLWAIQAKCYDPDTTLNKRDIDSFLSESARPEDDF
jgi:predicted helicase